MNLKPWREIIKPHRDVHEGNFQASEFAADLSKVAQGAASLEYQDASLFFERTFITEGMALLLDSVVRRMAGKGGDPVIQLQTAFGGGKTHSMLAAYHVAKGERPARELAGVPPILDKTGIVDLPKGNVAVLDGNALNIAKPRVHGAITANTLWGELAWQLGGEAGYRMVSQADAEGVSPGKSDLAELFTRFGPCVILMDETVAYLRQFEDGKTYSAGTFASNVSFIQALTEAVTMTPTAVLMASLPQSDLELGGERGKHSLDTLQKYFGRQEAVWKPVATEESFEIVRRRLFGPVEDNVARDAVCRAFADIYLQGGTAFPAETQSVGYYDQLRGSYPIHPEVFQRLYEDWATLEKFQRTRGVLRLMAMVIHRLWSDGSADLMIMPGSIPLKDAKVRDELLRYLPQGWEPVVDRDVDGDRAETTAIDQKTPLLGEVQAARRVARTIFLGSALGSAPGVTAKKVRGLDVGHLRLGCVQPGQQAGRYDDALRRLVDQLHYLYEGKERYWYDTRPNLRRTMEERKARFDRDNDLIPEIGRHLRNLLRGGPFGGVHVFAPHGDIPDDQEVRLVALRPTFKHSRKERNSDAVQTACEYMRNRGGQPRLNQNRLIFLASDRDMASNLYEAAKRALAWKSIVDDVHLLNLDQHQTGEAKRNMEESERRLAGAVREAYRWVLAPLQEQKPGAAPSELQWEEFALQSGTSDVMAAIKAGAESNEILIPVWSPYHLKTILDLWYFVNDRKDVPALKVWEDTCRYAYLPRLVSRNAFRDAVADGAKATEFFGYAQGKDADGYKGLVIGEPASIFLDKDSLLVEVNSVSQPNRVPTVIVYADDNNSASGSDAQTLVRPPSDNKALAAQLPLDEPARQLQYKRFYGRVRLDPVRVGLDAPTIAKEVIQHLVGQYGATVEVSLEIHATLPKGVSDSTRRTIEENCRTLKFEGSNTGFEKE